MTTAHSKKRNKVNETLNSQIKTHTQIITSQRVESVKKNPKIINLQRAKYANFPNSNVYEFLYTCQIQNRWNAHALATISMQGEILNGTAERSEIKCCLVSWYGWIGGITMVPSLL